MYVDAAQFSPLLQTPAFPAVASSRWVHERLSDPRLTQVEARMADLRAAGVTAGMIVKEFLRRRIAPFQRHSRPMWAFSGQEDTMRLQMGRLPPDMLDEIVRVLTGEVPGDLPKKGYPLYNYTSREAFARRMPHFDQWGLLPEGQVGPQDNPFLAVPMPAALASVECLVTAGGRRRGIPPGHPAARCCIVGLRWPLLSRGWGIRPWCGECCAEPQVSNSWAACSQSAAPVGERCWRAVESAEEEEVGCQ